MRLSRRRFLGSSVGLLAATRVPGLPSDGNSGPLAKGSAPAFRRPGIIHYDASCFTIQGADTFIYSLDFPYPRCLPSEWQDRFLKIRQAGFNTIDTYVFWNYHEREPGRFDFSDLEQFLSLAKESGLFAIVRPGPYVDAEFERGGFPAYVIAKRFPVRSMHPDSLLTSKHWYDHVLPIIRRHQITEGGAIILMQIENEMDFTDVAESEQREYIRFLAKLAWQAGIEVPLISNVSTVVRDRTDPDMAKIIDVCDFYPRWSFLTDNELPSSTVGLTMEQKVGLSDRAVLASLRKMRREEPHAPLSVAELGTGYYSKFGGKLSEDEEGTDASQLNALTKTIMGQGVTYINYYVGVGGTNFDWAAKGVTSTYDFAAPIREGGGLSDKYYEAKAIGAWIRMFGPLLARSAITTGAASCSHPDMTVYRRDNGPSAFLFVRSDTDAQHHYRLTFREPGSTRSITVPRHGQLVLGPRAMKLMPLHASVAGTTLRYSTAEILAEGTSGDRGLLLLYDVPGSLVEVSLPLERTAHVSGALEYQDWLQSDGALVMGVRVGERPEPTLIDDRLLIVVLPRDMALRTWVERVSLPRWSRPTDVPWMTDAYFLAASGADATLIWADIDYRPGSHDLTLVLPSKPSRARVDGALSRVDYDVMTGITRLSIVTPPLPKAGVDFRSGRAWVERLDTTAGRWMRSHGRTLEDMGPVPFGYVKYRATIAYNGESSLYLRSFTQNDKKVFINGQFVADASTSAAFIVIPPPAGLRIGDNVIEIVYELFGSTEFGETARMAELNGIESLTLGSDSERSPGIISWDVQSFAVPMRGREINREFPFGGATPVTFDGRGDSGGIAPAFTWYETEFNIPEVGREWSVSWKIEIRADRDALIYLNCRFIGRFVTVGPQSAFHIPEGLQLRHGAQNRLTILLAYTETVAGLQSLRLEPCLEYAARRSRVEIDLS
jgi:glycosyl hydrolase family 35/beta-galactosidase-like protein